MLLGKQQQQQQVGESPWTPATNMGDVDEAPGFGLQPGPALAILELNQQMEDLALCLSHSP